MRNWGQGWRDVQASRYENRVCYCHVRNGLNELHGRRFLSFVFVHDLLRIFSAAGDFGLAFDADLGYGWCIVNGENEWRVQGAVRLLIDIQHVDVDSYLNLGWQLPVHFPESLSRHAGHKNIDLYQASNTLNFTGRVISSLNIVTRQPQDASFARENCRVDGCNH